MRPVTRDRKRVPYIAMSPRDRLSPLPRRALCAGAQKERDFTSQRPFSSPGRALGFRRATGRGAQRHRSTTAVWSTLCTIAHIRRTMGRLPVGKEGPALATVLKEETMNKNFGASASPDPARNNLLAALPAADYNRLAPDLEHMPLPLGMAVYESGAKLDYVYFP